MATFSSEQLNFFKFSTVVLDEFPIALRKVFVCMWDTLVASKHGGQKWDNSGTVLNLFLSNEGGAAKVPTLNKFIEEWDCTALFKATLFAKTFAMPDGSGGMATLNTLYVKPHSLPSGTFHSSVLSPSGNQAETFALALDQLRLLRNTLCHQISTKKIDKTTLDQFLLLAKDAFAALGQETCKIDDIEKLGEEDFPTARGQQLEDELEREKAAAIKFKQIEDHLNQIESEVKGVGTDVKDVKTGLGNVGSDVKEINANVQDIKQAMRTENPVKPARLRIHIDAELVPGPDGETTGIVVASPASQLSLQSSEIPTSSSQQHNIDGSATSLVTTLSNKSVSIATQNVLIRIAEMYLQAHNLSTPEDFSDFENYMARIRKVLIVGTDSGSLIITVECGSLQILDELWEDYRTGHLNEMAQKLLVTEDILKEFNLLEVKLTTTILEEEYRACREYFLQFQELYSKVVETETTSEKETFSTMSAMDEPMDFSVPSGTKITEEEAGYSSGYGYSLEATKSTKEEDPKEDGDHFTSSRQTYIAVVAIDFGTTFSCFAFAFNYKGETDIYMNRAWRTDQGYSTMKTPTCLLLNADKSFNSFGYEAQDRFAELEEEQAQELYYFEHFKMILYNSENLNRETILEANNGKHMKALDVFEFSLHYLQKKALEVIRERKGNESYSSKDVQWVLTVPAIWKPEAKQFMREAAYKAGLASASNPEQIRIALEPEAASVYCRERKMREFVTESGNDDALLADTFARPETQYVVIDIGGGTLDVTVHQIQENGAIKEIYKATGGSFGGRNVNHQFKALLESIFTQKCIQNYSSKNPIDWLYLMNDFEVKKHSKRFYEGRTTRVRLPDSFVSMFSTLEGWDINATIQEQYSLEEIKVQRNEFLCLNPKVMTKLFDPVLNEIVTHLSNLFSNQELSGIEYVFLVGGFAESVLLQERIRSHFGSKYHIMVPLYPSLAVVQGAVIFGQKPDVFESRVMPATYGIRVHKRFLDGVHPESKREVIGGIPRCKDVFFKFIKVNEMVKEGEKRQFSGFEPVSGTQKEIQIDFYQSDRADIDFVTDDGVQKVPGRGLVLETPDAWKTKDIEINLYFGGTEIKVTAVNRTSKKQSTVCLDFLTVNN